MRDWFGQTDTRAGFAAFYWLAILPLIILGIGELLSIVTGQTWVPRLRNPFRILILGVLVFLLGAVRMLADEVFSAEDEEED